METEEYELTEITPREMIGAAVISVGLAAGMFAAGYASVKITAKGMEKVRQAVRHHRIARRNTED